MAAKPTKRNIWIPVVTGIIKKDGKVLLGLRPRGESLEGHWEFPGGKINQGESPEQALVRELQEELGIDAEVGELKIAHTHSYGERGVLLIFFEVLFWKGEPKTLYHEKLHWASPEELGTLPIPEANRLILNRLTEIIRQK